MTINIVDLVKDQLGDQITGQIGNVLGTDSTHTHGALSGAVPGLLSGLIDSASSQAGASALFDTVQKQDDDLLSNMGNLLGGDQASSLSQQGGSILTSLLGSSALGQLAGVVANFTGISRGNSSSLLGILAPIVLGVLKRQIVGSSLNTGSLANLLNDQQANVNAAMPQGFSDQLQSAGFFDSISAANTTATVTESAAPVVQAATTEVGQASSGGMMKWLLPLAAVLILGFFGMQYLGKDAADKAEEALGTATDATTEAAQEAVQSAQEAIEGSGVDLSKITAGIEGVFGSTTETLTGVTDVASAEAAVPALQEATSKLGGISDVLSGLPDAAKGPVATVVENGMSSLQPLIDKVTAIPGVGPLLQPVIDPLLEALKGLAG